MSHLFSSGMQAPSLHVNSFCLHCIKIQFLNFIENFYKMSQIDLHRILMGSNWPLNIYLFGLQFDYSLALFYLLQKIVRINLLMVEICLLKGYRESVLL